MENISISNITKWGWQEATIQDPNTDGVEVVIGFDTNGNEKLDQFVQGTVNLSPDQEITDAILESMNLFDGGMFTTEDDVDGINLLNVQTAPPPETGFLVNNDQVEDISTEEAPMEEDTSVDSTTGIGTRADGSQFLDLSYVDLEALSAASDITPYPNTKNPNDVSIHDVVTFISNIGGLPDGLSLNEVPMAQLMEAFIQANKGVPVAGVGQTSTTINIPTEEQIYTAQQTVTKDMDEYVLPQGSSVLAVAELLSSPGAPFGNFNEGNRYNSDRQFILTVLENVTGLNAGDSLQTGDTISMRDIRDEIVAVNRLTYLQHTSISPSLVVSERNETRAIELNDSIPSSDLEGIQNTLSELEGLRDESLQEAIRSVDLLTPEQLATNTIDPVHIFDESLGTDLERTGPKTTVSIGEALTELQQNIENDRNVPKDNIVQAQNLTNTIMDARTIILSVVALLREESGQS